MGFLALIANLTDEMYIAQPQYKFTVICFNARKFYLMEAKFECLYFWICDNVLKSKLLDSFFQFFWNRPQWFRMNLFCIYIANGRTYVKTLNNILFCGSYNVAYCYRRHVDTLYVGGSTIWQNQATLKMARARGWSSYSAH